MKLSVVIVNFNVCHFLEQALLSVQKAIDGLDAEVFVVDNNSVDESVKMVEQQFPWVKLIANKENTGFSKANNQAIKVSSGQYVLLLNPDTVLQEDSLHKCCEFMDQHSDCGGLGVRMIDGKGKFLPESKRGLPTPSVALFKMIGLSTLFPKSRLFGRYHLKYLSEHDTHEVEVLSGAFMMLRKRALDSVGLLDEAFFMYGEDIDLSYRLNLGGWKNFYYPGTTIIHYKGESTKKKSANYVKIFYNAMVLFAQKHYSSRMAGWFAFFISIAVRFRALLALVFRLISSILLPIADFTAIYAGFYVIARYWEVYNKFVRGFYPDTYYLIHIPGYILLLQILVFFSGGYDKPVQPGRLFRGTAVGAVIVFSIYAFLPKDMQFSRAILFLGFAWALLALPALRLLFNGLRTGKFTLAGKVEQRIIVVAGAAEAERIRGLIASSGIQFEFLGFVSRGDEKPDGFLGELRQLDEIAEIFRINQIIYSAADIPAVEIMETMSGLSAREVNFKIVPENSAVIIGSNSKNLPGELYTVDIRFSLADPQVLRKKRLADILICLGAWILTPYLIFNPNGRKLLGFSLGVLAGTATWVSYMGNDSAERLPPIKQGIVSPGGYLQDASLSGNADLAYARDYSFQTDLRLIQRYLFG